MVTAFRAREMLRMGIQKGEISLEVVSQEK